MEDDFAQGTTPVGALRGILGNYPYSVGLLREILQNSDDARASRQVRGCFCFLGSPFNALNGPIELRAGP